MTSCSKIVTFHQSCEFNTFRNNPDQIPDRWCIIHTSLLTSTSDTRLTLLLWKRAHILAKSAIFYKAVVMPTISKFMFVKFNLGRVTSLRTLLWWTVKTEFSLCLIKLRIIYLNFQEWHFDQQRILSTSFKFLKKDTPCNCADKKIIIILIFYIYIYIYIYIYTYK